MVIIILSALSGCTRIMHQEDVSIGKIESYDRLVTATNGLYGKLAEAFNSYETNSWTPYGFSLYIANAKGDDVNIINQANYSKYYGCHYCNQNTIPIPISGLADIGSAWKALYLVIATANNIINQKDKVQGSGKEIKHIMGEVYLIRAYCYFRLVRTYGRIPIVDNTEINYHLPKPSFLEIYRFIEHDLQLAAEMLPKNNTQARMPFVTPNRGTAKAILAEVYLTWAGYPIKDPSKYALAAKESGEVIDSAGYFGFGLDDDFAWLWDKAHYYNKESVFTLYFADPDHSTVITEPNNVYYGFLYPKYYGFTSPDFSFYTDPQTCIRIYFYATEINFFNNYPESYRKDITFFNTIYVPENFRVCDPVSQSGYIHIDSIDACPRIAYRKFFYASAAVPYYQYPNSYGPPSDTAVYFYFGN